MKRVLFFFIFLTVIGFSSHAQDAVQKVQEFVEQTMNDTTVVPIGVAPMNAPPIMANKWNQIHTKNFNLNFGFALLLDHNITDQNAKSIEQVGKVGPATQFRGDRFVFSGDFTIFKRPWRYNISLNFNGLDANQGNATFSAIDWNLEIPFGKKDGWLTIGKQKEGVGLEYISPGTQGMFMERGSGAPMFIRQRNIGIRYSNVILDHRMTYTFGVFNNYWETGNSFSANGSQVTARVTALPMYESDREMVHLGLGYRYTDATSGSLSYKAKPEVNSAPSYISTGSFDGSAAQTLMGEFIGVKGPLAIVAEYMGTFVNSNATNNPFLNYFQVGGSWFITGENRRYNKQTGNQGKLIPKKNFRFKKDPGTGAFELGVRYTRSNANDHGLAGGEFSRFTSALSWYPNAHFRFEINYGYGTLNNEIGKGVSNFYQFRIQFEL
jgi:phosphate-selective porin OprO/OprP